MMHLIARFRPSRRALRFLVPALLLAAPACRSLGQADPSDAESTSRPVTLLVTNDNNSDVDIFIMRSGLATRLGRVNSGRSARFTLTPAVLGPGEVSFVASISNGNGAASSGSVVVQEGRAIEFRVAPVLRQSRAVLQ